VAATPDTTTKPSSSTRSRSEVERAAWQPFLALMQQEKRRMGQVWQQLGLTPPQAFALLCLRRLGPSSMVALADVMHCDASNITGLVDKLEARRLIERQAHPQDRRVKLVVLTADGETMHQELTERMATPPAHFASLSVKDLKALHEILMKIAAATRDDPTVQ
jgi:MarR family transcriptional regulator, organic hydroperoxide resistance regulator